MILWAELGLVNQTAPKGVKDTPPEMIANAQMQLTELIRQNYNHPSVAMWSIGNEVTNWSWKGLTPSNPRPLMEARTALAKREDTSDEGRGGEESASTGRSRGSASPSKKKNEKKKEST